MITFTWCDWSWKSTIIWELKKDKKYINMYSLHYYSLIASGKKERKISVTNIKKKNNRFISIFKELLYSNIFFIYIIYIYYAKKKRIFLDRTFQDVYIDLKIKNWNNIFLKWFMVLNKLFLILFKDEQHILLTTNSYKTNFLRKKDELEQIFKEKYLEYERINKSYYKVINTEEYSIKEIVWKITS